MHPRIRTQAYLVGAVPLAFLLILLALAAVVEARSQASAILEQRTQTALSHVDQFRALVNEAGKVATAHDLRGSARRLAGYRAQIEAHLRALDGIVWTHGQRVALSVLRQELRAGMDLVERYAALRRAGRSAAATALADAPSTRTLANDLTDAYTNFVNRERRDELAVLTQLRDQSQTYEVALLVACLVGIALTLLVSGRFGFGIAQRLERLAENARRLAGGEPAESLQGNDEFSDLDRVYREMMQRIAREHRISSTLQRMLLPQQLPSFPGIRIDTAYEPAAEDTEVGGDWYDAFTVGERCICISIGDVAGHGLRAATVMAGARIAVRTAARMNSNPAEIVAHLNQVMCADQPDILVTALVAMLDVQDGTVQYAVAGHPEPLLIRADGATEFLSGKGLLLGADAKATYETFETRLDEGSSLLLYTDGLIEVEHDYFKGLDELCDAACEEFASSSENIAEAVQRRVFHGRRAGDDAAVLFLGVIALGASNAAARRTWDLDARDAQSAYRAKRAILWQLGEEIHDKERLEAIELVLGELIGNVARHSPGPAQVTVEHEPERTLLRVCDRGKPFTLHLNGEVPDLLSESGRGLFLVRNMAHDMVVEHTGTGNSVTAVLCAS